MNSNRRRLWLLTAVLMIGTFGSSVRGQLNRQAFILLIDTSTSMKQKPPGLQTTKMMEVRRQLGDFAVNMPAGNRLTVFSFDQSPPLAGPDVIVSESTRAELARYFSSLREIGQVTHAWTSLEAMLARARQMIQQDPALIVRVFAYTDGEDNERPRRDLEGILDQYDDILRNRDRIRVDYITLGFELGNDIAAAFARHGIAVKSALTADDFADLQPLVASFDWSPTQIEAGIGVGFNDRSVGYVDRRDWSFGDGTTSTDQYPVHAYQSGGTYTVTLNIATRAGETASQSHQLIVSDPPPPPPVVQEAPPAKPPPHAMFGADEAHGKGELKVEFENRSSGTVERYVWNFGDGSEPVTQTSIEPIEHTFKPGRWAVSLTAEGPAGLGSDTYAPGWHIVVGEGPTPPLPPKSWTRHLIWIVPLGVLLMILLLLMRRTDDEEAR